MKENFLFRVSRFFATTNHKLYANYRNGCLKNGGCILTWHHIKLAHIYAIIGSNGDVIVTDISGILSRQLRESTEQELMQFLVKEERKNAFPRNLNLNYVDSHINRRK